MLGAVWDFIKRHKKKFIFAGVVVGGAVFLGKYAETKLRELQEKEMAEQLENARKKHHFDNNQRTCNMTVLSMIPSLRETLMQRINTEELVAKLKSKPPNKVELWEDLKIDSFTRVLVALYGTCILVVLLRVQLNIIGGYMYLDSLLNLNGASKEVVQAPREIQERYLASIQYLLGDGLTLLIRDTRQAVQEVIGSLSLRQELSLEDLHQAVWKVRREVERAPEDGLDITGRSASTTGLTKYMLPEEEEEKLDQASSLSQDDQVLQKLLSETRDMIESVDFQTVLSTCLEASFTRLCDEVGVFFSAEGNAVAADGDLGVPKVTLPMAKVIPVMNGQIHQICSDSPNKYVQELLLMECVKDFAANVYEAFSQAQEPPGLT
ncbi:PREDICTED: peroxisomal biogenesis factor 3-like [Branchiostoma belcheri]|uniref:Peroxisomal biogenesis factor 3 n=1 Tax=Branchiostoma belcheri TaxID=7741 RepID=A0A6P5A6S3_BRABE|nr:PREDICTED: peroxisomal biogenesis factor 3-like [Branchiostoma belcheri]